MSARQRKRQLERRQRHSAISPARRRVAAVSGLTAGAALAMSGVAHAAVPFTVGSLDDTNSAVDCMSPANTDCTLRKAINDANFNAGADTIVFRAGLTGTIDLTADLPKIIEGLDILGPGAASVTVAGGGNHRAFYVNPATADDDVSISGLTISHSDAGSADGGAVDSVDADLTISNMKIQSSYALGNHGGAIYADVGSLAVDHSTVAGSAADRGGGIASKYAPVTVTDSTITGNTAQVFGGGIWTGAADLTVSRSTIDHNYAYQDGGGIYSSQFTDGGNGNPLTIERSTIASNHAIDDDGGGVYFCCNDTGDALTVVGSTISGNTAATAAGGIQTGYADLSSTLEDSIVSGNTAAGQPNSGDLKSSTSYYFDTTFSLVGMSYYVNDQGGNIFAQDPHLAPLAENGGPTRTRLPAMTSPVVDQGDAFGYATDQRGLTRPFDFASIPNGITSGADGSDMGAVEVQPTPPPSGGPGATTPAPGPRAKKKCKKRKHKRSAESAKKKKCKKKKRKKK